MRIPPIHQLLFVAAMAVMPMAVFGQGNSYNPYLIQGIVSPAPMLPAEFNGTGQANFDVGNTGSTTIPVVPGDLMTLVVTLSKGIPNNVDPIAAVSGPGKAWFSWTYDPSITTYFATQIAPIPGGARETITIDYKVTQNSFLSNAPTASNGFNVNIQPPGYTNPQPTDDDAVSSYTYVEAFDFGDAPISYTAVNHSQNLVKNLIDNIFLQRMVIGTTVDPEVSYQASANATGDNTNQTAGLNVNDEDGVTFPAMIPGTTVNVPVSVTLWDYNPDTPPPGAALRAWVDWDKNGVFAANSERVINFDFLLYLEDQGEAAWSGPRTFNLTFPVIVPVTAAGNYFSRFRFGPAVSPTAINAAFGEVEDYMFSAGTAPGTITGKLYIDTNGDGNQDIGEPNLPNVNLTITDSTSGVQTVTTDSNGNWTATVPPGSTTVDIDNSDPQYPTGYTQTEGNDPTVVVAVSSVSTSAGNDGFYLPGTITGHLYIDTNGNGIQDGAEPDLANVDVIITDVNNNVQTVVTDSNGDWTATVPPGSTSANIDNADPQYPAGYIQTEGTDPTVVVAVAGTSTSAGNDGFHIPGTLTGRLYIDTNGNGTQDVGEPGIANVDIIITDVNNVVQTVTTNSNGDWTANVPAGSTSINIDNNDPQYPTGYTQTEGTDPTVVVAVSGSPTNGGTDGFFLGGSISGITQVDTNIDDVGDLTINNVTYRLLNFADSTPVDDPNQAGVQPYVIVSTNGMYAFSNLPPGQYIIVQDQPAGFISQRDWDSTADVGSSPVDPANTSRVDNQIPIALLAGESDNGNDFVEYRCPTLFDAWQLVNPSAGGNDANPDGDLYSNVLEYAFCMPPNNGGGAAYCIVPTIGGNYDIVFHRVAGAPEDLTYFLRYTGELSTAPAAWTEVSLTSLGASVIITTDVSGLSEQVRITNIKNLLPSGSERGFYQIAVKLDYNDDSTFDVVDYTYVEGWQEVSIEANECETYSNPFLPCPQFVGTVTSMTGLTLDLSTSAATTDFTPGNGTLMPLPTEYRIEVMSGPLNGHRFSVVNGGVASLTLEADTNVYTGPPFGSLDTTGPNLQTQLTGAQIMLVKMRTIEELVPVAQMNATTDPNTADRVLYNDGVAGWLSYWAFSNSGSPYWRLQGSGNNDRSTDIVAAHQGFFIHTKANAEIIRSYGLVRQSNFAQPINTTYPMLGSPYPMNLTPTQMAYLPASFTGSRDPATSDQVLHWTRDGALPADTDGYSSFWLTKTTSPLRNQWSDLLDTTLANQNNTAFIYAGRAYWFRALSNHPNHIVPVPWALPTRVDNNVAP